MASMNSITSRVSRILFPATASLAHRGSFPSTSFVRCSSAFPRFFSAPPNETPGTQKDSRTGSSSSGAGMSFGGPSIKPSSSSSPRDVPGYVSEGAGQPEDASLHSRLARIDQLQGRMVNIQGFTMFAVMSMLLLVFIDESFIFGVDRHMHRDIQEIKGVLAALMLAQSIRKGELKDGKVVLVDFMPMIVEHELTLDTNKQQTENK